MGTPEHLIVLYDEECALCRRCRQWLEGQETYVLLEFHPAQSETARDRFGTVPWLGADLVVVDNEGRVWAGPAAFLVCLWATVDYRMWAFRLSGRTLAPLAERFFHMVSANRRRIGAVVGGRECPDGRCGHRAPAPALAAGALGWQSPPAPRGYRPLATCGACGSALARHERQCWYCGAPA